MRAAVGAMDNSTDASPVFYESKQLTVTGMRVSAGSTVFPVSAITTVEILRPRTALIGDSIKMGALGLLVLFLSPIFSLISQGSALNLMTLLGALLAITAVLVVALALFERTLHVCPSSGNSMLVRVYDKKVALEMRAAVARAMTYHANSMVAVPSAADELGKLALLRSQGVISDADWERAKDLFLGKRADAQEQAVVQLRQLHDLYRSGVLSESEFNMKKWDILAANRTWAVS